MLPSGPLDGRKRHIQHLKACRVRVFHIILQHLEVNLRLTDNALLPTLPLPASNCGLIRLANIAVLGQQAGNDRQYQLEGNERHVDDAAATAFLPAYPALHSGYWCAPCT